LIYNLTIGEPAGSLVPKSLKKTKPKNQPPSSPVPNGNGSWITTLSDWLLGFRLDIYGFLLH